MSTGTRKFIKTVVCEDMDAPIQNNKPIKKGWRDKIVKKLNEEQKHDK